MFTPDGIRAFHAWTHESLDRLFSHVATVPQELFTKEVDGFGFASLRDQLAHLLECEALWVGRLRHRTHESWDYAVFGALADLQAPKQRVIADTLAYLDELSPEVLNEALELRLGPAGFRVTVTPAQVLHHALTHAFHHKGQAVAMCRILGYPAPDTDLGGF